MKNKKLLAIILLSLSFCFVSGVGSLTVFAQGFSIGRALAEAGALPPPIDTISGTEAMAQRAKYVRRTFLIISKDQYSDQLGENEEALGMLWKFLSMYPDAEIPEEFILVLPSGANSRDEIRKAKFGSYLESIALQVTPRDLIISLLLTMAYQQGYKIEQITSRYVILVKSVYEKELKEWKDRLNE